MGGTEGSEHTYRYAAAAVLARRDQHPDPVLLRANRASLYRCGDTVVRIERPHQVNLIHYAQAALVAGVATPAPTSKPLHYYPYVVTSWQWIETQPVPQWHQAGQHLRRLHENADTPARAMHTRWRRLLHEWQRSLPTRLPHDLHEALAHLDDLLTIHPGEKSVFTHGDLHPGNLLWAHDGPHLIDWELTGHGPASWDLVPMVNQQRLFRRDNADVTAFLTGYGSDPRGTPLFEQRCRAHAALLTLGAIARAQAHNSDQLHDEAQRRINYWNGQNTTWTAY